MSIDILHLEDDPRDVELVEAMLLAADMDCQIVRVQSHDEYDAALRKQGFDVILGDYRLPGYDGISALRLAQELCPDIPFVFVSGTMGEDAAIEGLTQGATDYVLKQRLSRLVPAIKRALNEAENRRARKHAEDALKESAERFRAVAESANEGIISADSHGMIIYWNRAAREIFGYLQEEIIGQPLSVLMPKMWADQRHHHNDAWEFGDEPLQSSRIQETVGYRKDGSKFPIEFSIGNWNTRQGAFFTVMVRDETARKQAEENLRLQSAALEAAANGIMISDREGSVIWVNSAFTRLTGYEADDVIGKNPRILKSNQQEPAFYQNLWETILSGKVWHSELVNRRANGNLYTEEMTISPVRQKQGEISHFIAIKQDVTERKHHEIEREMIISVANAIRTATTRVELLTILLNQLKDLFNANGVVFAAPNIVSGEIVIEMGCGDIGERFTGLHVPPSEGISSQVILSGKLYLNNNLEPDHPDPLFFRPDLLGKVPVAAICVPLIAQGQVIGVLWLARGEMIAENDVNLLLAIANLVANALHRVTLHERTEQQFRRLAVLHQIDIAISTVTELKVILNVLLNNAITQLEVDAASILLLAPYTQILEYAAGIGFKTHNIQQSRVPLGRGRAGVAAIERRIVSLPNLDQELDSFTRTTLLTDEKFVSHIVAPLVAKGQTKGVLEVFCRKRLDPPQEWYDFFETLATQAAIAIDNATLLNNLQQSNTELILAYDATIEGWSRALDLRDKETEGHTQRVTEMALRLADIMGMNDIEKLNVRRGALLHDIGKMGIPDSILLKPGALTEDEWAIMRQHPTYAYEMLAPITYLKQALDIPHYHHEKWDGNGYPDGLKGEQIPLAARIFAVVDVFDALTSDRPYRSAWSVKDACQYNC